MNTNFLQDPIILTLLSLILILSFIILRPRIQPELWLLLLTVLLFALPRAGVIVKQMNLPLPLAHVIAVLVIIEWLLLGRSRHWEQTHFGRYFLLYAVTAGLGLAIGMSTGGKYHIAIPELFFYLVSMGLFFYASETFSKPRHFLLFAGMILFLSVLVSLYGIAQKYLGGSILIDHLTYNSVTNQARSYIDHSNIELRRVLSSYGDPNVLASQLLVFIGMALALVVSKGVPGNIRLLCLGVLCVNVWSTFFTGSRAGMIAMMVVTMIVLTWRTRWALLVLPLMGVLAFIFGPQLLETALAARFQGVVSLNDIRAQFPAMAWQLLQAYPLGCGLGNTIVLELHEMGWSFAVQPAHVVWSGFNSFWLNLFSRLGIPGLISFLMLLIILFRYIWSRTKQIEHPLVKPILIGGLAGFIGQWLTWIVNNTYALPGGGLNFWFMMGIMVAGCRAFAMQPYPTMLPLPPVWSVRQTAQAYL